MQPKLGSGGRFANLKAALAKRPGVENPGALAASIGRKKFGEAKMSSMATTGRKRRARKIAASVPRY